MTVEPQNPTRNDTPITFSPDSERASELETFTSFTKKLLSVPKKDIDAARDASR
jgi:hypothetical protein